MREGLTLRELLPLVGLAFSAFIFNTSEFMPVGLLTGIGSTFSLTEAQTGWMISIYAWAVMLLSVPLMVLSSRVGFRPLLLALLALFTAGQVGSALAPSFETLIAARLLVACAHAVFWSIASPVATRVVSPSNASLAMGIVVTGSSVAMIMGLPLGRAIGLVLGWRMTFGCVAAVSALTLAYLAFVLPRVEQGEPFSVRELPSLFRNPVLVGLYAVTVLFATGYYTGYSYIEPFLAQVAGASDALITAALTLYGCSGLVGSVLFSRFYDRRRMGFIGFSIAGLALALALMRFTGVGLWVIACMCAVWGVCGTVFNVAFQAEVIRYAPGAATAVAMSIFSGLFNLGIGCGSALGGVVVDGISIEVVGFAGAVLAAVGFVAFAFWLRHAMLAADAEKRRAEA